MNGVVGATVSVWVHDTTSQKIWEPNPCNSTLQGKLKLQGIPCALSTSLRTRQMEPEVGGCFGILSGRGEEVLMQSTLSRPAKPPCSGLSHTLPHTISLCSACVFPPCQPSCEQLLSSSFMARFSSKCPMETFPDSPYRSASSLVCTRSTVFLH